MKSIIHDFTFLDKKNATKSISSLILLNTPFSSQYFQLLSQHSNRIICADGGANRLFHQIHQYEENNQVPLPFKIIGDLDSLSEKTAQFYRSKAVQIIKDQDQDSTDFQKALNLALSCLKNQEEKKQEENQIQFDQRQKIFLLGGIGRMDHTLSSLSNILKYSKVHQNVDFILTSEDSLIMPLMPSSKNAKDTKREGIFHEIHTSQKYQLQDGCGLVPINRKCQYIETQGLKWNLEKDLTELQFGVFISTSNYMKQKSIKVWNSDQLLWTTSLKFNEKNNFNE